MAKGKVGFRFDILLLVVAVLGIVVGVLPGLVGTIQATEAIKIILGIGKTLAGRLLTPWAPRSRRGLAT